MAWNAVEFYSRFGVVTFSTAIVILFKLHICGHCGFYLFHMYVCQVPSNILNTGVVSVDM